MSDYRVVRVSNRRFWHIQFWEGGERRRLSLGIEDTSANRAEAEREARRFWIDRHADAVLTVDAVWDLYGIDRAGRKILERMIYSWKALAAQFAGVGPEKDMTGRCRSYMSARRKVGRADGTIWTELNHLRIVLTWGFKRGLLPFQPHVELPTKPDPKDRHLKRAEAEVLLAHAARMPHLYLFTVLALTTAARTKAILELTWDRVDFERGTIALRDPTVNARRKGRATVPMNDSARAALEAARKGALSSYVIEWAGRPIESIKKGFAAAAAAAGLEDVSPHVLRHTAAVWMAEDDTPMEEIAQYLGHADVGTTRRIYARFSPSYLRRAASSLELKTVPFGSPGPRRRIIS